MIEETRHISAEMAIIGTGLAGFAAAIFALDRGLTVAQIGNTGALAYTTGYFDLYGYEDEQPLRNPWQAIERLADHDPNHPLAGISPKNVERAFGRFIAALEEFGIGYSAPGVENLTALLPAGLSKPTLSVPRTMLAGIDALATRKPTLIVDFHGLAGFSAREFVANFSRRWPTLSTARIGFPEMESGAELFAEVMARALEVPAHRRDLAARIKPLLGEAECVGLPAILGVNAPDRVHAAMEDLLGVPLFEIPTMPPAVPGVRLRELFEQALPARGVHLAAQRKVECMAIRRDGVELQFHDNFGPVAIHTETALLTTGRFLSGGLTADRQGLHEPLLDLFVRQPGNRDDWYREDYFDRRGHAINRAGLVVDDKSRPIATTGAALSSRLFAAGAVLSDQDWIRERSGAGLAIATAWRAVEAAAEMIGR
ncbi:MAG: glycerol-3-phosphate dehydrogenase subunit GlpB [Hyphomicrobiales bacterium]|nr:glycerol-3-phosphate dehydrogenase subunit GlpB [Hyphomicrobiales bacterium]